MPVAAAQQLAQRYSLQLDAGWIEWFDDASQRELLGGRFRSPIDTSELLVPAPPDIWPGFMLPDTLPIVSNDYGDWWCIRIGAEDRIVEVIQWSHGGGDWMPVGSSIAQAALWDHIEQFRAASIDSQPAAHEYPQRAEPAATELSSDQPRNQWLARQFDVPLSLIEQLSHQAAKGEYRRSLKTMFDHDWASAAVACELVEIALQGRLAQLADNKLAARCGMNWTPDYTSWLFDTANISADARHLLTEYSEGVCFDQDWEQAESWALAISSRRHDLAWTGDVSGWAAQRRGDVESAARRYFDHRHCSAFTDQSIRLRSHWFPERMGKFSVAQLQTLVIQLPEAMQNDAYLQLIWREGAGRLRAAVREHWLQQAREAFAAENFRGAFDFYIQAGWDIGAERMSDYMEIMDGLIKCATLAGWHARAQVVAAHAECLRQRLVSRL